MNKFLIIILVLMVVPTYLLVKAKTTLLEPKVPRSALFSKGSEKQIREFLETPDHQITITDYYYIIGRDRTDILELVLKEYGHTANYSEYKGGSPLTYAAKELKRHAVELLVKYGADVNYVDDEGNTALILASKEAFAIDSLKQKGREISKILVDAGADVNAVSGWWRDTPLHGAIISKDMVNVKYLVDHGADINFLSKSSSSHMFSCFNFECVLYFLDIGLDINFVNNSGQNFIQNAITGRIEKVEEIKKLIELGADICHKDNEGKTVLNYIEVAGINPHRKIENPDFYYKEVEKHKNTKLYKYLKKEYNKKCLEVN